ncbi:MAG: hypothetical protein K9J42_10515 [Sulfuritalea sp.]|nr:hypothetical protein [Sulfuritalea sp.]
MFDIGDPWRNAVLTGCFFAIASLTLAAVVPWKALGAAHFSKLARWICVPVLLLAIVYETAMPSRFDIRIDLLLLVPMYGVVLVASVVRWIGSRGAQPVAAADADPPSAVDRG